MEMHKIGMVVLLLVFCLACEKEGYHAPEEQPVYFEYHFINHAWGYQDFGWLVAGNGKIWSFEYPDSYQMAVHGDFLSLEQLQHNVEQADSIIGEVSQAVLERKKDLIPVAAEGEIKDFQRQGADMGVGLFACYKYDPTEDAYQYILLSMTGDHQRYNSSKEADKLVEWLKEVVDGYNYY
jgi:hypothetical protein